MALVRHLALVWLSASLLVLIAYLALPTGIDVEISGVVLLKMFAAAGVISLLPSLLLVGLLRLVKRTREQHPERMPKAVPYVVLAGSAGLALILIQLIQAS